MAFMLFASNNFDWHICGVLAINALSSILNIHVVVHSQNICFWTCLQKCSGFTENIYFAKQTFDYVASQPASHPTNQWWPPYCLHALARIRSLKFTIQILKSSCENCWSWNVRNSSKQNWTNQKFPFRNSRMNLILNTRYVCLCSFCVVSEPATRNHHAARFKLEIRLTLEHTHTTE